MIRSWDGITDEKIDELLKTGGDHVQGGEHHGQQQHKAHAGLERQAVSQRNDRAMDDSGLFL